jgi:hypothetical protein
MRMLGHCLFKLRDIRSALSTLEQATRLAVSINSNG